MRQSLAFLLYLLTSPSPRTQLQALHKYPSNPKWEGPTLVPSSNSYWDPYSLIVPFDCKSIRLLFMQQSPFEVLIAVPHWTLQIIQFLVIVPSSELKHWTCTEYGGGSKYAECDFLFSQIALSSHQTSNIPHF